MADKFHSEAPTEIYDLLRSIVAKHHSKLIKSRFLILFKHGGWKSKKRPVLGKFKVWGDDLRSTYDKDAVLYLNADLWYQMSPQQKLYVLDQALYSLDIKCDKHDQPKLADDGRPLLGTVAPDVEAYVDVIRRHGPVVGEIKRLEAALKEMNQLTIEDAAAANEEEQTPAEPREGIRGKINPDGTADADLDEYDEKNQLTLEQAAGAAASSDDPMSGVVEDDF